MSAAALGLAWFLNWVFGRSFQAIALILLAMLIVALVHRIVEGGIPERPPPEPGESKDLEHTDVPTIHEETKHLRGADYRYGWMALPPLLTAIVVLVSIIS